MWMDGCIIGEGQRGEDLVESSHKRSPGSSRNEARVAVTLKFYPVDLRHLEALKRDWQAFSKTLQFDWRPFSSLHPDFETCLEGGTPSSLTP